MLGFQENILFLYIYEPPHDKTDKMTCVPSEDSDQPGLIRVFAERLRCSKGPKLPSCAQQRL